MPTLKRPTVDLEYTEAGSGQQSVVLLHGWCDERHTWDPVIEELSRDFRCLAPDVRGHGGSGLPVDHDYSFAALTNDVAALVRHTGTRAVLVGHSYGGVLAALTAARHQAHVAGAMIIDQPLDFLAMANSLAPLAPTIRARDAHLGFRRQFLTGLFSHALVGAQRDRLVRSIETTPVDVALALWSPLFEWSPSELEQERDVVFNALAGVPSTVIDGAETQPYHDELRRRTPATRLQFLTDSGHYLHLTRTLDVVAAIRELTARTDG